MRVRRMGVKERERKREWETVTEGQESCRYQCRYKWAGAQTLLEERIDQFERRKAQTYINTDTCQDTRATIDDKEQNINKYR